MPPLPQLKPYWETTDKATARLYLGDVRKVLRRLPSSSVHCVVTSPPYWGLRDYGTGTWEGGREDCDHSPERRGEPTATPVSDKQKSNSGSGTISSKHCPCGARRVDLQIGSEPSPDCETKGQAQCGRCFVCTMVEVFREVRRVLRDDGTLWLNLGDSYNTRAKGPGSSQFGVPPKEGDRDHAIRQRKGFTQVEGLSNGNLVGVPWRVALALQADGWILRSDVIWHKPAPMPESVRNRCTKAHEYVFQFAKKMGYYFDQEAIKEGDQLTVRKGTKGGHKLTKMDGYKGIAGGTLKRDSEEAYGFARDIEVIGANKRTVWSIDDDTALRLWLAENAPDGVRDVVIETMERFLDEAGYKGDVWSVTHSGYKGAHFAVFPAKLVEPCILATTSAEGCCSVCSAPLKRIVEGERKATRPGDGSKSIDPTQRYKKLNEENPNVTHGFGSPNAKIFRNSMQLKSAKEIGNRDPQRHVTETKTLGWGPTCECYCGVVGPCTVLDPFAGSGTTVEVSINLKRRGIGIELSEKYMTTNLMPRVVSCLLSRISTRGLVPMKPTERVELPGEHFS